MEEPEETPHSSIARLAENYSKLVSDQGRVWSHLEAGQGGWGSHLGNGQVVRWSQLGAGPGGGRYRSGT